MVAQHVSLADEGVLATVAIGSFTTEAGAQLSAVDIAYQRWGEYRGSNVLLIEHALTGDSDVATWWCDLVGPGKALDTDTWCVIATNVLGGCNGSTGPSSF